MVPDLSLSTLRQGPSQSRLMPLWLVLEGSCRLSDWVHHLPGWTLL